ncbi:hypothetical protein SAMN06269185_1272 [Natronoarchaeum philippinense]|uniref:DUF7382 domain-containing protein n=1 Tax=Natronoarchaeum philippinense TaxID=558529 RepID=A0A285NBA6_NATPI|nr:carboxypeptidase-like regulatory domain-containing protein [Natronoarchaeum philippinense]SNZ06742.1 hypothetical protein SAMN06269185_1272 [Natronoarchaeum philippinense]
MRTHEAFISDDRAIEGLPIRLVIALVVGVASLSIMMSMLGGIGTLGATELDAQPNEEVIDAAEQSLSVTVVDESGEPVEGATIVVDGDSAQLDEIATGTSGADGSASVRIDPELRQNQDRGTLKIDIKPPSGTDFQDERQNTEVLVVDR